MQPNQNTFDEKRVTLQKKRIAPSSNQKSNEIIRSLNASPPPTRWSKVRVTLLGSLVIGKKFSTTSAIQKEPHQFNGQLPHN
jgi:hypothetical protein